jgi:N-acetylneuraminic acid mutarotase
LLEERCVLTPVVSVLPIAPQQRLPFHGAVATFTDPANPGAAPGSFSAAINWGDRSGTDTITPSVTVVNGQLTVSGSHTYTAVGTDTLTVTVTEGNSWTTRASMPTARRAVAAVPGPDGQLYVFGGENSNGTIIAAVEAYNPATNSWTTRASMPTPRRGLAAAPGPDGQLYAFGGQNFNGDVLPTVEAYNPATDSWTTKASMPTARDFLAAAAGPDGQLYVFGGFGSGGAPSAVEAYNPATNSWTTKASMPTARPFLAAAAGPDGQLYVFGGSGFSALSTVEAYSPATNAWTTRASMPTARSFLAAAPGADGQLYVFGGQNSNGGVLSTVEAYNPATNSWTTRASMPTARRAVAAAPGPDGQLYVFGGDNFVGFLQTGNVALSTVEAYLPAGMSGTGNRSISVFSNPDRVGLFHGDGTWTLDLGGNGSDPVTFRFGAPGDQPIVGDWNGSGFDAVGTVRVAANAFAPDGKHALLVSLDYNGDRQFDSGDVSFYFGEEGDQLVLGDWNGDGRTKLGVVRPDGAGSLSWSLDFSGDHTWVVYHFGLTGDTVVSGDWTGTGTDKIGVVRADASVTLADGSHPLRWSLDKAGTGVFAFFAGTVITFGTSLDVPLLGDWNGDGRTKVGAAGPAASGAGAAIFLDVNGDWAFEPGTEQFAFGLAGDVIFRGDWAAGGTDNLGVARASGGSALAFTLDSNGDRAFDAGDAVFTLPGRVSDEVFAGKWHP